MSAPTTRREHREQQERKFRDEITAGFRSGKIGIENGWLVGYVDMANHRACTEYGCPPSCYTEPIVDLWAAGR